MVRCPYCDKELTKNERYCFDCEQDISEVIDKEESPRCFIATAAYGSASIYEVQVLRNFRDDFLENNFFGRIFISIYYKVSPPIARFIEGKEFLKKILRKALNPIVRLILILR